jgi:pilus assembly protein Flp/PilA
MIRKPSSARRRQAGQGMVEYLIIIALIAIAGIGLFAAFGDVLQDQMSAVSLELAGSDGSEQIDKAGDDADEAVDRADAQDSLSTYNDNTNAGAGD